MDEERKPPNDSRSERAERKPRESPLGPPRPNGHERWLVAAWPGLGHVATTAAVYLLSKLQMHEIAEFDARDLFELDSVVVRGGLVRAAKLPRSRLFFWGNPGPGPDIVIFLGEAQPPMGKLALCHRLLEAAKQLGVTRVFTFAAMAIEAVPSVPTRTFAIATDPQALGEVKAAGVPILAAADIGGLNGVLLGAAAEAGLHGIGLLAETPHLAAQLPYASASAAVLKVFLAMAHVPLELSDLEGYGASVQQQVARVYEQVRQALLEQQAAQEPQPGPAPEPEMPPERDEDAERLEALFAQARKDRTKAFELKKELDRLGRFREYEDRFLSLFREKPGGPEKP